MVWLLLADMRKGRLLCCRATNHGRCHVEECETIQNDLPKPEYEVSSPIRKRAGMTYGIEDQRESEELKHFVRQLNEWLPRRMHKHAADRLVVIAPARFLGELRTRLKPELKKQLDMRKGEWIHLTVRELAEHHEVRALIGMEKHTMLSKNLKPPENYGAMNVKEEKII